MCLLTRILRAMMTGRGRYPMGETTNQPFQLSQPGVGGQFQRVTSDGGLILVRELDKRLGFTDLIAQHTACPADVDAIIGPDGDKIHQKA
jgi:hypothetical protein